MRRLVVARYMIIAVPGPVPGEVGRWGVPPVPVVTTLARSNYAHLGSRY